LCERKEGRKDGGGERKEVRDKLREVQNGARPAGRKGERR
jgi:hypothetical protein